MFVSAKQFFAAAVVFGAGLAASSVAGAGTLNIVGCDSFSGDIATGTITCVNSTTPPSPPPSATAPSGCSATASPSSLPVAGGTVNLTASCSTGAAVASATWTRTRSGASTSVSAPDTTVPGNSTGSTAAVYTYTARLCAADGSCTSATTGTVTVPAGVAAAPATCGSLSVITPYLEGNSSVTEMTFSGQRFLTQDFNGAAVVVGTIRVPAGASGASRLQVYEYVDTKTDRRMWVSRSRCDMSQSSGAAYASGKTPTIYIRVGGTPSYNEVLMQPGETWYLMVRNEASLFGSVSPSCSTTVGAHCNVGITAHTFE